jgi:hypothetical protein
MAYKVQVLQVLSSSRLLQYKGRGHIMAYKVQVLQVMSSSRLLQYKGRGHIMAYKVQVLQVICPLPDSCSTKEEDPFIANGVQVLQALSRHLQYIGEDTLLLKVNRYSRSSPLLSMRGRTHNFNRCRCSSSSPHFSTCRRGRDTLLLTESRCSRSSPLLST